MRKTTPEEVAVLLLSLWLILGGSLPVIGPSKATAATYVHAPKAVLPAGVMAGLNELNAKGIVATSIAEDATDGDGQVPEQYKHTLPAAKVAGIPSLVVQSGETVIRTVKAPTTKQQVLEAVP